MLDGLLVVDKPAGCTSHDVVARVRKAAGQRKVGHAGTLDPDATGVLLVGLGRATRLMRFLSIESKSYRSDVVFGVATDTLDAAGRVVDRRPMTIDRDAVVAASRRFLGEIDQVPPMVSAVKIGGRRLHEIARAGEEVERAPRRVRIDRIEVEAIESGPYPVATILVECGSGTYIRALAADLGAALGGFAHVGTLRRLSVGSFTLDEAHTLDEIEVDPAAALLAPREAVRDLDPLAADDEIARAVAHGSVFPAAALPVDPDAAGPFAVVGPGGSLLAVYERRGRGLEAGRGGEHMRVARDTGVGDGGGSVVTIGAFDGVHLGHREVLRLVNDLARARDLEAAVVTFDRHPAQVVRPDSAPKLLTTLEQKLELLEETGLVDVVCVLTFDEARSSETAEEFVEETLVDQLHARLVVVGADFHFGHRRGGNVALLERKGADHGFEVIGLGLVSPEGVGGEPVSSTRIRRLLDEGDVAGAAALLGRPHAVRGTVETGDQRGRELGFPTANLAVAPELCLPADGIYAGTFAGADRVAWPAAISLGRRPTFYEDAPVPLLEAFVLDFTGDLYGQAAEVGFVERLRGEAKFDSIDALVEQMHRYVEATRGIVG